MQQSQMDHNTTYAVFTGSYLSRNSLPENVAPARLTAKRGADGVEVEFGRFDKQGLFQPEPQPRRWDDPATETRRRVQARFVLGEWDEYQRRRAEAEESTRRSIEATRQRRAEIESRLERVVGTLTRIGLTEIVRREDGDFVSGSWNGQITFGLEGAERLVAIIEQLETPTVDVDVLERERAAAGSRVSGSGDTV